MSDADTDAGADPEQVDPNELVSEALEEAVETIVAASDGNAVEKAKAERDAVEGFAEKVAKATQHGLPESSISQYAGAMQNEADHLTKSDVKSDIDRAVEAASRGGDADDAEPLHAYLKHAVIGIDAVRTTDHKQSTLYRWHFSGGTETGGGFSIETGDTDDAPTSTYSWRGIRSAIFDASGVWTTSPPQPIREEWSEFIGPFIKERQRFVENKGARTLVVEELQNHVSRSVAYPTVEDMFEHHGVMLDEDPDEGDPTRVCVRAAEVSKICEEHGINTRALQVELDARDMLTEYVSGASESTYVNGSKVTYWVLSPEFAEPETYQENPETNTERFNRLREEDGEGDEGDSAADPGVIGSSADPDDVADEQGGEGE